MTDITIPKEAEEAVARSMCDWDGFDCDEVQTAADGTTYVMWQAYIPKARAACLAMIKAWPRMAIHGDSYTIPPRHRIILPLSQESGE